MISKQEYIRKLIHLSNLIIPASYHYYLGRNDILICLFVLASIFLLVDLKRKKNEKLISFFDTYFDKMMRKHEINGALTGATWVMISAFVTVFFFPKHIAILALIFMSIGDTVAAIIGRKFGKINIGEKTFEGFLSGFLSCLIISYFYTSIPFSICFYGSLIGMLSEIIPLRIDDNFKIPISSGIVMYIFELKLL
tara:strand:- start:2908 stop:3492 length:585 start_codon:yes stop_codon:yes gene_type:complete